MVHSVSPLVLMVLYMYVIVGTTEFRYSRIIIWISCSHVKCTKEIVSSLYSIIYMYIVICLQMLLIITCRLLYDTSDSFVHIILL